MGDKTGIEWTDATWNPVTGCDRTSPGCDNCYALKMAARLKRMGQANYQNDGDPRTSGPGFAVTCHPHMLDQPLRWKRPRRIFVNSMSDLFHQDVPNEFIAKVFAVMGLASQHTFQVLTKRPQRMAALLTSTHFRAMVGSELLATPGYTEADRAAAWLLPTQNVWLGTSIESDQYSFRADHLRATPAAVRFISAEPLLGPLPSLDLTGIDWLIVGGESGPGARPMHPDWVRELRDRATRPAVQDHRVEGGSLSCAYCNRTFTFNMMRDRGPHECDCRDASAARTPTAFHFKQWGEHDGTSVRVGKHAAGRELDGRTWDEFPGLVAAGRGES